MDQQYDLQAMFRSVEDSRMSNKSSRPQVTIYSDGSYKPQIEFGGYGSLMYWNNDILLMYGGSPGDSNNRMELTAVLSALRHLTVPCDVTIYSDSKYVVDALNGYLINWVNNGWRTSQNKPVSNQDLWMEMYRFTQIHRIIPVWIKGHAGHPENEQCDRLASMGAYCSAQMQLPPSPQLLQDLARGKYPGCEEEDAPFDYYLGQ